MDTIPEKKYFILFISGITLIAILLAFILHIIKSYFLNWIPWWIELPSILPFVILQYYIFNNCLWHTKLFKLIGLVKFPDLRGRWEGYVVSSYNKNKKLDFILEIQQTFSNIHINAFTSNSRSYSTIANFVKMNDETVQLHYEYRNEPDYLSDEDLKIHYGTAHLRWPNNVRGEIIGDYYNSSRDRPRYGTIHLEFLSRKLKNEF